MLNGPTSPELSPATPETCAPADTADIERKPLVCPNCAERFHAPTKGPGQHKRFCSPKCRTTWQDREKKQGAVAVTILKIWRTNRGSGEIGKAAFAELCSIADILIDDDRKAGRLSLKSKELEPFVRALLRDPYNDRKRWTR